MSEVAGDAIRVLHVDDNADLADLVATHLERTHAAIEVETATSAEAGLEQLREAGDRVDCVVSDHDMPGMDGLDFLRGVRSADEDLPFVLFTGKGSEEIASEAISAGVTEYLQKGTGTEQYAVLANRIERAVGEDRAKEALEESERMFSTLISNLPGMVYRCRNERGWPMEFVSEGCEELTGHPAAVIERGEVLWGEEVLLEEDREEMWERVQTAVDAGEPFEVTYRIETADGDIRWLWERGSGVHEDGDLVALEGFITDITARKHRERELREQQEFVESLLDMLGDPFYLLDTDGNFVRWNDRLREVTGYTDQELSEMVAADVIADDHVHRLAESMEEVIQEGRTTRELDVVTTDGEHIPFEMRGAPVRDTEQEFIGTVGVARDMSERQARERELERTETIIQAVDDPVYALDATGHFTFVNDAFEPMTGYSVEDLLGEHISTVVREEDVVRGRDHVQEMIAGDRGTVTYEIEILPAEGDPVPSELHIASLPFEDEFRGTAGIIRDIAERKEREERLEEFASVVSHDLRGPLNVIIGRIELARESGDMDHLAVVEDAAHRMATLVEDLLALAREGQTVGEAVTVSLDDVAAAAWSSVEAGDASLVADSGMGLRADPDRLRELLENLFHNAVQHGGDDVTVRVLGVEDGFAVADDGTGIEEPDLDRVFDQGFTTSQAGTGFGLAIVKRIAEGHDWSVDVTRSEDGGARFEFRT